MTISTNHCITQKNHTRTHTNTHTHLLNLTALCLGLPGWAGTRKVKQIWILLKQETVSGSGISWAVCKSAPRSRQITMPAPNHSVFYRPEALPAARPTVSMHWTHVANNNDQAHRGKCTEENNKHHSAWNSLWIATPNYYYYYYTRLTASFPA